MEWENQNKIPENEPVTKDIFQSAMKDILSGFFLDFIYPLQKQIKELGHTPAKRDFKNYSFTPKIFGGRKEFESNDYLISSSKYFGNLAMLLFQKGFIQKTSSENFVNAFNGDGLPSNTNVKWMGQENLCVYMIDKLIDENLITDRKKNICTEVIFDISNVAQKRDSYLKNKNAEPYGKPKGYQLIDEVIEKAFDNKSIMFGDVLDANFNKPLPK